MSEEEMLAGVCMDDLPDQSLADMVAADAKIPVSVKDQGSYNIALTAVLDSAKADSQSAVAAHVATEDPHAQYIRGTEIGETLCPLEGGVIPSRFFPASYDEVQYYDSLDDFPSSGFDNVIYVSRNDGFTWRWGGEAYHRLNASLALGETADTAYPGNKGKVAYDHALAEGNPHRTTPTDIGLGNVDNSSDADKPVSTATATAISTASTADRNRENHTGTQAASTISDFAATVLGTVLTGLSTATNAAIAATDTVLGGLGKLQAQITANLTSLTSHTSNTNNPHGVTKTQIGLGNVDNTSDADKPVSTAAAIAISTASTADRNRENHTGTQAASTISDFAATVLGTALAGLSTATNAAIAATDTVLGGLGKLQTQISANLTSLTSHTNNTNNPHGVTKGQVGLGNVDNTSDADKPVSTATATALANKEPLWVRANIASATNWDSLTSPGSYRVDNWTGGANGPTGAYGWGELLVSVSTNSNHVLQMYCPHKEPTHSLSGLFTRVKYDTWTDWSHYADSTNFAKRATGTTLSLSGNATVTAAQFVNGITFIVTNGASVTLPPTVGAFGERCFFCMTGCIGGRITVNGVYKSGTQNYFGIIAEKNAVGWSVC